MSNDPGGSSNQSATHFMIGAGLRLGRTQWALESIVQGKEWTFRATPASGALDIRDAINALAQEFGAGEAPFKEDMLPKAQLESLTLSAGDATYLKGFVDFNFKKKNSKTQKDEDWFKLIFAFARLGEGYLAGIRSVGPIWLAESGDGVVGQLLGKVVLDQIGLYYASADIDVDPFVAEGPAERYFPKGLSIACRIGLPNSSIDVALNSSSGLELSLPGDKQKGTASKPQGSLTSRQPASSSPGPPSAAPATDSDGSTTTPTLPDGRYWVKLDKTLGPLQLRRIGGEWAKDKSGLDKLGLLLDATIELAGLTVALAGLVVRVPPSKLTTLKFTDVEFGLDGLELDFQRGPISISGALLKTTVNGRDMYSGMASIRAATFSIGAIGSYGTTESGEPSFFIFGAYTGVLGGPPCFVVEGIAAGFGYNRAITLPDIDQVRNFPLVSLVLGKTSGTSTPSAPSTKSMLGQKNAFPPATGQYWIAAGVKFSSFKLIEAFALATVQFGARLEIALLGVATLQQPPRPAQPFIVVEMALKVRFAPDDGLLSVEARLTANSYLFDPSCRLTGGFAFYVWFKPTNLEIKDRSGDFVFTLGGYHPKFRVPDYYPTVPRVGFNWQLPDFGVLIKGEAYFALTPSFVMAGFRLTAVFSLGDFRAWFEVYADFVMGWEPFHYSGDVGVRIGASYTFRVGEITVTLSFELAAKLTLWGPPFAGEAFVDLGIVAFTVPIGDLRAPRTAEALKWKEFAEKFLPVDAADRSKHAPLEITIASGMVYEFHSDNKVYTVVKPSELCLSVESFVPVTSLEQDSSWKGPQLGIRPMQLQEFVSTLKLVLVLLDPRPQDMLSYFDRQHIVKSMPEALWSPVQIPSAGQTAIQSNVIENCLMGVRIKPKEPSMNGEVEVPITIEKSIVQLKKPQEKTWVAAKTENQPIEKLRTTLDSPQVKVARKAAVDAIGQSGFDIDSNLADAKRYGDHSALANPPWFVPIGGLLPQEHGP
jgi:hypothetical protein